MITRHLDALNEAAFWSCWTIFYTDLKGLSVMTNPDLAAAVELRSFTRGEDFVDDFCLVCKIRSFDAS